MLRYFAISIRGRTMSNLPVPWGSKIPDTAEYNSALRSEEFVLRHPFAHADSRIGLEAWLAGMDAANDLATMFGVHGAEKVAGGFVLRLFLRLRQCMNPDWSRLNHRIG